MHTDSAVMVRLNNKSHPMFRFINFFRGDSKPKKLIQRNVGCDLLFNLTATAESISHSDSLNMHTDICTLSTPYKFSDILQLQTHQYLSFSKTNQLKATPAPTRMCFSFSCVASRSVTMRLDAISIIRYSVTNYERTR